MNKRMKLTTLGLVSALLLAIAAPMTAHAGSMTIYNDNCTHLKGFKRKKFVTVYVKTEEGKGCTDTKIQVKTGHPKTIQLATQNNAGKPCGKYAHYAKGAGSAYDVKPDKFSSVTCKRDFLRICWCTKD